MLPIQITGHNIEITDTLNNTVNNKFSRLRKHSKKITRIHVILNVEKLRQIAEATLHIPNSEIYAKEESEDMYKSIDGLIDKLVAQLDRVKEREKDSRRK